MELNEQDIDLLDRFHRKQLSADELFIFQAKLREKDFSNEVKAYLSAIEKIELAGRLELIQIIKNESSKISSDVHSYNPSKAAKGGGSGGFFSAMIILIVGAVAFYIYKSNTDLQKTDNEVKTDSIVHIQSLDKATIKKTDTVYHYRVKRDTVYLKSNKPVKSGTIIKVDTIYSHK